MWLRSTRKRSRMESDMDAELRFHLEAYADDLVSRGVARPEALRRARLEFGGVDRAKEECREARGVDIAGSLIQDLRYGLRKLRSNPGFTAVALFSLALGIGANSTVFSIVDSLFLRPWPVKEPAALVAITTDRAKDPEFRLSSFPDYADIGREARAFSDVVAYGMRGGFISGQGQGREVDVEVVSQNYFAALGVNAWRGRVFSPAPEQAQADSRSVVISYRLWQRYFGADPSLPGKTTILDGQQFTVVGIAPREFCGLRRGWSPGIWVTTGGWATMVPGEDRTYAQRDNRWFELSGRLRPGFGMEEARAQVRTLSGRLAQAFPETNQDVRFLVSAYGAGTESRWGAYLMAMVGLVLLISCANVANLLLAQMERRQREIAMRRALGAGQRRLIRQLLTEGLVLSLAGGALGVLLTSLLMRLAPALVPDLATVDLQLDHRVLLFTAAVSFLMAFVFGLAPALRASRADLIPVLKGDDACAGQSRRRLPLRSLLVAGEIAFSVVLLAGSALLLRSLVYSQRINPGFDTRRHVLMMTVAAPVLYGYSESKAQALYPELAARAETVPGVLHASYARRAPLTQTEGGERKAVSVPGHVPPPGTESFKIRYNVVGPKFFATVGARLMSGREFNRFDTPSSLPVVIINKAMARRFWPEENPVGRSIQFGGKEHRIVGVVETGRYVDLHEESQPYLFVPFTQDSPFECMLLVQTAGDPQALVHTVLRETAAVDRNLPMLGAITLQDHMRGILAEQRSMAALLASLSILGMCLAAVGLYAAVAYVVNRRTHEIGVRVALGARKADVLRLVLAQGIRLSAAGAAVGLAGAFVASRLISRFLYGVASTDLLSYAASVLIATGVALVATYLPARRAMRVDPIVALRYE
ncbi:MAG TPA: ABC transporter permease [Bryobacteraceae bacterium]|nr:ABC transporter permease [Bryobacteraceae bacterium]